MTNAEKARKGVMTSMFNTVIGQLSDAGFNVTLEDKADGTGINITIDGMRLGTASNGGTSIEVLPDG